MKNTDAATGTQMPDFSRVNLNKYDDEALTLPIIFGYLTWMSELMNLLCDKGRTLLTKTDFLSYSEYEELFKLVFNIWRELWQEKSAQKLLALTVEKGIASLAALMEKEVNPTGIAYSREGNPLWQWYCSIEYQLQPGARLGIGSHGITAEKSRELIESMVPIVQRMQNEQVLENLARDRFPGDEFARKNFVAAFKNW